MQSEVTNFGAEDIAQTSSHESNINEDDGNLQILQQRSHIRMTNYSTEREEEDKTKL